VDSAREQHAALNRLAEELRQPLYRHFAVGWEVVWAQMAGRVAEAERLAQEAYDLGRRAQARDADTVHAAQLLVLRRREDRLQEYISTVESFVAENPALVAWRSVLPLAHMVNGDAEAGIAEFERLAAGDFAAVPRDMFWFTATALLAETCALLRDTARARVLYDRLLPHRSRMVQATQAACLGSTERFLGLLAGALGEWDTAVAHLEAGLERNAARGIRPVALRMRRELAEALLARARDGDAERAAELLRRTLAEAEMAGMASFATLVRSRIAELE
jgi:tetratricopeptide (TPR) repeat protein